MPATNQTFILQEKLATLEAELLKDNPMLPNLLREIHRNLKADPDLVTLLTEDECCTLVKGLKKQTNTEIATVGKARAAKKVISRLTVEDL